MKIIYLFISAMTLLTACGHRHHNDRVYVEQPRYERSPERVYVEEDRTERVYVKERPRLIEE